MLSDSPLLKIVEPFKTSEDVRNLRESLEDSMREVFKDIDRRRRLSWIKAREIVLD